jgi:hypothetical protein
MFENKDGLHDSPEFGFFPRLRTGAALIISAMNFAGLAAVCGLAQWRPCRERLECRSEPSLSRPLAAARAEAEAGEASWRKANILRGVKINSF